MVAAHDNPAITEVPGDVEPVADDEEVRHQPEKEVKSTADTEAKTTRDTTSGHGSLKMQNSGCTSPCNICQRLSSEIDACNTYDRKKISNVLGSLRKSVRHDKHHLETMVKLCRQSDNIDTKLRHSNRSCISKLMKKFSQ